MLVEDGEAEIRFVDLFAGVGGFHLGLTQAGILRRSDMRGDFANSAGCGEDGGASIRDGSQSFPSVEMAEQGDGFSSKQYGSKSEGVGRDGQPEAAFRCVWANEWDKYAASVYRKNFPETPLCTGDIREVPAESVPDHDLLCAGFPCQAFSVAGKRRGLEEARGTLFYEIARVAERKRPRMLLLENVKGLLSHDEGRTFALILRVLGGIGYRLEWQVLNSKWFGVPQNRERVFLVGHLGAEPTRTVFPITEIGGDDNEARERPTIRTLTSGGHSGGLHSQMTLIYEREHGNAGGVKELLCLRVNSQDSQVLIHTGYKGVDDGELRVYEDVSPTISTPAGGGHLPYVANCLDQDGYLRTGARPRDKNGKPQLLPIGYRRIRRLTPIECERLQAFPDGWTSQGINEKGVEVLISDTQRYKMMGNAVTTSVVRFLGERIRGVLVG